MFGAELTAAAGASVVHGALEEANGGTIFISSISKLPIVFQRKVVQALEHQYMRRVRGKQDIPINVRFVAALERGSIESTPGVGFLRRELYYRISPILIHLPLSSGRCNGTRFNCG